MLLSNINYNVFVYFSLVSLLEFKDSFKFSFKSSILSFIFCSTIVLFFLWYIILKRYTKGKRPNPIKEKSDIINSNEININNDLNKLQRTIKNDKINSNKNEYLGKLHLP